MMDVFSLSRFSTFSSVLSTSLSWNVRLPAEEGEHVVKVLFLLKSVCGLKTSGREFVQQVSEQILTFTMKVKCPKPGEESRQSSPG
jgi:hypothetical protein